MLLGSIDTINVLQGADDVSAVAIVAKFCLRQQRYEIFFNYANFSSEKSNFVALHAPNLLLIRYGMGRLESAENTIYRRQKNFFIRKTCKCQIFFVTLWRFMCARIDQMKNES